eukprot:SAG31_NODE_38059_length_299_cov_0.855000_1_plen_45_part_10
MEAKRIVVERVAVVVAPSSLTVAGLRCLSDANGVYRVSNTIGGKP